MRPRPAIFGLLQKESNPAVEPALLAALPGTDEETARRIIELLLARDQRAGLVGLVVSYHELPDALKALVLGAAERLVPLLRECFQLRSERTRLNVLELIRRGLLFRASYLLETALHDPSTEVFAAAASTLRELTEALVERRERGRPSQVTGARPDAQGDSPGSCALELPGLIRRMRQLEAERADRGHVAAALLAALSSARLHLQPALIEAAIWLAEDLGMKLWSVLSAPGGKALRLAAWVFETSRGPRMVPFAMAALHHAEFRPFIVRALAVCTDAAFWEEWYRQCWRTYLPAMARNMATVREAACIGPRATGLLSLSPAAQRRAAAWLHLTSLPVETKLLALRELQRGGTPGAQRAAVWTLCNIPDLRATTTLSMMATDGNPETAMAVRLELARRQPHLHRPKDLLASARAVGPQADDEHAGKPIRFEDYWAGFDLMTAQERVVLGHEMLLSRPGAESLLRKHLTGSDSSQRLRALRVIAALGRFEPFAEQLYPMAHDAQAEVRSAAVVALGKLGDATSRLLLHGALLDPDARVQANAIEAIEALREHFDAGDLLPKLNSADNRVRANAVGALLKLGVREAAETLLQMLQEQDRAQRISALWLVEHMGLLGLVGRVMQLADHDKDAQVRERARKLAERLQAQQPAEAAAEAAP